MKRLHLHKVYLTKLLLPFIIFIFQLGISNAQAESVITNFSADNVTINAGGQQTAIGKLYVSDNAIRVDGIPSMAMLKGIKLNLSVLLLKQSGMQYVYNHDKKSVYISSISKSIFTGDYKSMGDIKVGNSIASEMVSGYLADKKSMLINYSLAGQTISTNMFTWENSRFKFPLKLMDEGGNIQILKNIQLGEPAANVFVPLSGYQKVDSLMAVLGLDFSNIMQGMNNSLSDEQKTKISNLFQQTIKQLQ